MQNLMQTPFLCNISIKTTKLMVTLPCYTNSMTMKPPSLLHATTMVTTIVHVTTPSKRTKTRDIVKKNIIDIKLKLLNLKMRLDFYELRFCKNRIISQQNYLF